MITPETARDISARNDAHNAWVDSIRGRNGWSLLQARREARVRPRCDQRSQRSAGQRSISLSPIHQTSISLYVDERTANATTWTGETLGKVSFRKGMAVTTSVVGASRLPSVGINGREVLRHLLQEQRKLCPDQGSKSGGVPCLSTLSPTLAATLTLPVVRMPLTVSSPSRPTTGSRPILAAAARASMAEPGLAASLRTRPKTTQATG